MTQSTTGADPGGALGARAPQPQVLLINYILLMLHFQKGIKNASLQSV